MGFRFERQDSIYFSWFKKIGLVLRFRSKLLDGWSLNKCHIVLVGRGNSVGMTLGGFFDQLKKCQWLFYPIDDEGAVENFVAAVFGVDL